MILENERPFDVKERFARKWITLMLAIVLGVGLPTAWFGSRLFSQFQQGRLLGKARESLSRGEVPGAAIFLRRVVALNPGNVEALRAMADIAEKHLPSEAPALRERVSKAVPSSYADAQAWAEAALRIGQAAQAEEAFELMKRLEKPSAAFHEVGARIALAFGRLEEARGHFAKALELDPANDGNRVELAAIELQVIDPAVRDAARERMEGFRANPKLRHAALRALVGDRIRRGKFVEAHALAREFIRDGEASFEDRMQYLRLLRWREDPTIAFISSFDEKSGIDFSMMPNSGDSTFAAYLNEIEAEARENPVQVALLITFLNSRRLSLLASEWASTMKRDFVSVPPIAPSLAETYRMMRDWRRLADLVSDGNWGEVEFLRFAYVAFVLKEKGDSSGVTAQWGKAVALAGYRPERLDALARITEVWGWTNEREEILWITARNSKHAREALAQLTEIYRSRSETQKLFDVWTRILELDPSDFTARKNWVRLSFLLKGDPYRTGAMAEELYRKQPDDPDVAITYALVQNQRELHKEALAIMNRLSLEQLRSPLIAGFYGVILSSNRLGTEAAESLARAKDAPLLREEQALMDTARRSLR